MGMRIDANPAQDNTAAANGEAAQTTVLGGAANPPAQTSTPEGEAKPEAKPEGQAAEGNPEAGKETKAPEGAPEKYEFKAQEGTLAPETLGRFEVIAKEFNLSNDKAQKLVDLAQEHTKHVIQAQANQWNEMRKGWIEEIKNDKELGGDKFNETIERAKRSLRTFGDDGIYSFLEETGFGDNSHLIRLLAKIDKATGEDRLVDGLSAGTQKSAADYLYDNK